MARPDFSLHGIDGRTNELCPPDDIPGLWASYCQLPADRRRQFLQAAAKWQEALSHWGPRMTLSFALMVVTCEALKPQDPQFNDHNLYPVIEGLLGKPVADRLQQQQFRAQDVRSAHLHRGEFRADEFVLDAMMMSSFRDPTFDQVHRDLWQITQAALIEWLRRGGTFTMRPRKRRRTLRRWAKEYVFVLMGASAAVGSILGWLGRTLWAH